MRGHGMVRLRLAVVFLLICAWLSGAALASEALIPGGEVIGIQMDIQGVLVADLNEVWTGTGSVSPAKEAGVRTGDVIVAVNGCPVDDAAALSDIVSGLEGTAELTVLRDGKSRSIPVTPAVGTDGGPRLGLWLRDGITGVGTVTYIDPDTGSFGALGHGVNDLTTGSLLPADGGHVYPAEIVDVKPGLPGSPGELAGHMETGSALGRIGENTASGIFGVMDAPAAAGESMPVAGVSEIRNGAATILACVSGREAREYAVEITRTGAPAGDGRDLIVRVTDPQLLAVTGGIVQGMSGSPILQEGRLVGAVTHVLVGDPTRGYGIFLENMLAAAA